MVCLGDIRVNTLYKGDKDKDNNNNNNNNVPPILYYKYQPQIHVIKLQLQAIIRQSVKADRTVHNNRSDIAVFDIIMKEAHSVDTAIPNSHDPSQHHHRGAPQVYRLERRADNNMATVNCLPNTASAIHSKCCCSKHISLLDLRNSAHTVMQEAVTLNTCRIV